MVVEGDAGRDDVDKRRALVLDRRLDDRHQLLLVAGEGAGHESRTQLQGHGHQVDAGVMVGHALLALGALVRGCRELSLGEAVDPVVLDDVGHVDPAPDGMGELAQADRGAVPVAGNAQVDQVLVGQVGAGQDARHAAVDGVESVARAQEIVRRL